MLINGYINYTWQFSIAAATMGMYPQDKQLAEKLMYIDIAIDRFSGPADGMAMDCFVWLSSREVRSWRFLEVPRGAKQLRVSQAHGSWGIQRKV